MFSGLKSTMNNSGNFARVSESEGANYQAILLSEISKKGTWPKFSRHIRAMDAHDILNMLMG